MASYVAGSGEFTRDTDYITTRITADGRDGYPVEPGRYRLVVARACPWANRAIIGAGFWAWKAFCPLAFAAPPTTSAAGRSISIPPASNRARVVNKRVYTEINNGVYRCGFAGSQQAYEAAYDRLFTTLARFDAVYHGHFKCNRSKLSEMPVLWAYARDLFQTPGFGDTVDFVQIKQHYIHRPLRHQPHRDRAEGARPRRLADTAWARSVGRQAVRRRHAARPAGRSGAGARRPRRLRAPQKLKVQAHRPFRVRDVAHLARGVHRQLQQLHHDPGQPPAMRVNRRDGHREPGARAVDGAGRVAGILLHLLHLQQPPGGARWRRAPRAESGSAR